MSRGLSLFSLKCIHDRVGVWKSLHGAVAWASIGRFVPCGEVVMSGNLKEGCGM